LTKWLTVLPESSPINTILKELTLAHQGAACQHSHLSSIIVDLTASTSQVLKCIKQKSAVHHDPLAVHIAKGTAACEQQNMNNKCDISESATFCK